MLRRLIAVAAVALISVGTALPLMAQQPPLPQQPVPQQPAPQQPRPAAPAPQAPAPQAPAPQAPSAAPAAAPAAQAPALPRGLPPGTKLPEATIGVVDIQYIMRESVAMKSLRDQFEKQRTTFEADLSKREDDLRKQEQALAQQRATLSAEAFAERRRTLENQAIELQRQVNARRRQLAEGERDSIRPVEAAVMEILQQVATERNLNLILPQQAVLLKHNDLDLTAEVLNRVNQKVPRATLKLPALKTN